MQRMESRMEELSQEVVLQGQERREDAARAAQGQATTRGGLIIFMLAGGASVLMLHRGMAELMKKYDDVIRTSEAIKNQTGWDPWDTIKGASLTAVANTFGGPLMGAATALYQAGEVYTKHGTARTARDLARIVRGNMTREEMLERAEEELEHLHNLFSGSGDLLSSYTAYYMADRDSSVPATEAGRQLYLDMSKSAPGEGTIYTNYAGQLLLTDGSNGTFIDEMAADGVTPADAWDRLLDKPVSRDPFWPSTERREPKKPPFWPSTEREEPKKPPVFLEEGFGLNVNLLAGALVWSVPPIAAGAGTQVVLGALGVSNPVIGAAVVGSGVCTFSAQYVVAYGVPPPVQNLVDYGERLRIDMSDKWDAARLIKYADFYTNKATQEGAWKGWYKMFERDFPEIAAQVGNDVKIWDAMIEIQKEHMQRIRRAARRAQVGGDVEDKKFGKSALNLFKSGPRILRSYLPFYQQEMENFAAERMAEALREPRPDIEGYNQSANATADALELLRTTTYSPKKYERTGDKRAPVEILVDFTTREVTLLWVSFERYITGVYDFYEKAAAKESQTVARAVSDAFN